MKHIPILLAATFALTAATAPARAQNALANWTVQNRDKGARTLTPPDLAAGENYSVTVYPSQPMGGQSLEKWLRAFVGPVGTAPGSLRAPKKITARAQTATGIGAYNGPNGTALNVAFTAINFDGGANVSVTRTLFSSYETFQRYKSDSDAILQAVMTDARDKAGGKFVFIPPAVNAQITPGGAIVPGVYAGAQTKDGQVTLRYRLYLYANGESRVTNQNDADLKGSYGVVQGVGTYKYYAGSGQLDLDKFPQIYNDDSTYAFYGRDSAGKAKIVAGDSVLNTTMILTYDGPPTKRPSPATVRAREIEDARFKWVTAPGKGVTNAQIAAVVNNYVVNFDGMSSNITNDTFLLLKDGTITDLLPVPPDELDAVKSRAGAPKNWGKWRAKGAGYEVSWNGKPYAKLPGEKVLPAASGTKLSGRFGAVRSSSYGFGGSYSFWGATFDTKGRFRKDGRGGSTTNTTGIEGIPTVTTSYDEGGSAVVGQFDGVGVSSIKKKNPNGGNEGDYSTNGYEMTLRFDNGSVVRMPFFFRDASRKQILFEGDILDSTIDD